MKKHHNLLCLSIGFIIAMGPALAQDTATQDSTGLPGDNFSLQGTLEMFKKAGSPEDFVRGLERSVLILHNKVRV